jgi:5'-3' exonuclease, N-terminal resolvase-like domain
LFSERYSKVFYTILNTFRHILEIVPRDFGIFEKIFHSKTQEHPEYLTNNMNKLFLLDAMALIYRAHFAFQKTPRISSTGMNTSAVFGFANTLLEVISKEKPTHIGVAFDTSEPTFRHIQFEAYKAQREKQPEDISIAIPYVKPMTLSGRLPNVPPVDMRIWRYL